MKINRNLNIVMAVLMTAMMVTGCSKEDKNGVDTEYPTIDLTAPGAFPKQCAELKKGETFTAVITVTDNMELGSMSIDVHHNFDHHTHSTEIEECTLAPIKDPVNPFLLLQTMPIPAGQKTYTLITDIAVPGDVDAGDYHFMIRVTDKEGWQTIKGLSIKIK